jgi:alpha-tubulin suppressor-like RCC1 family protein
MKHLPDDEEGLMGIEGAFLFRRCGLAAAAAVLVALSASAAGPAKSAGRNDWGQLGNGGRIYSAYPIGVALAGPARAVAPGTTFTLALLDDGSVVAWGDNSLGQLGDGTTIPRGVPGAVHGLANIEKIHAGYYTAYAIDASGNLWAWGYNASGQIGDGTTTPRTEPVQVTALSAVRQVSGGYSHGVALDASGTVWTWGENGSGQLGDGTTVGKTSPHSVAGLGPATAVAANVWATFALLENGTVWAWGHNTYGTLGDGTGTNRSSPVQVMGPSDVVAIAQGYLSGLALTSSGTVWGWGMWLSGSNPAVITGLPTVTAIAAGDRCFFGLEPDGTVWGWKNNSLGQLANGTTDLANSPTKAVALGSATSLAVFNDTVGALKPGGSLWLWGANDTGQLGDGRALAKSVFEPVAGSRAFAAVSSGSLHTVALAQDGTVWGWGKNLSGQLGTGGNLVPSSEPVRAGTLANVVSITAGQSHSTAVKTDGTVWWWGGYLMEYAYVPAQKTALSGALEAAAGNSFSLVRKADGTVWGWGMNGSGQLGDGTTSHTATPVQVQGIATASGIAAGGLHGLAPLQDGSVVAWGDNSKGQLGDGTTTGRLAPVSVLGLPGPAAAVRASGSCSFARLEDGSLWAWGANDTGQLGDGTTTERHAPVQVTTLGTGVAEVASSGTHTIARKTDGSVWAWGRNDDGELGNGDTLDQFTPIQVAPPGSASAASAGFGFSVYLSNDCAIGCTASVPLYGAPGLSLAFQGGVDPAGCPGTASYDWDFGDGSAHGAAQNPDHAYASSGNYGWLLTVVQWAQTCTRAGNVSVAPCGMTCAAEVPGHAQTDESVNFSGSATMGIYCGSVSPTFDWDFGDGSEHGSGQNVSHTYAAAGAHTWTLNVSGGGTSCTKSASITLLKPPAASSMAKLGSPFRINVTGSGFVSGVRVFIDGTEWTNVQFKSSTMIKLKGGAALKAAVPKGAARTFRFLNPDGGESTMTWSW